MIRKFVAWYLRKLENEICEKCFECGECPYKTLLCSINHVANVLEGK